MTPPRTAVLAIAHGTPDSLEDLPLFLQNIRRGRPAPDDIIREVRRRYEAIGGRSPLYDITANQARALGERLDLPWRVAMRLWKPYAKDIVKILVSEGIERIISVPIAPYSVHVYHSSVADAISELSAKIELISIAPWNLQTALITGLASEIDRVVAVAPTGSKTLVLLTAHSLPVRVVQMGDPYANLVRETAAAVTARLSGSPEHRLAFQSQGMTSDEWLGPDLPTTFREARSQGFTHVVLAPIGFLSDHVEILYDIDIEAQQFAREAGLTLARTNAPNDSAYLIDALESSVRSALP